MEIFCLKSGFSREEIVISEKTFTLKHVCGTYVFRVWHIARNYCHLKFSLSVKLVVTDQNTYLKYTIQRSRVQNLKGARNCANFEDQRWLNVPRYPTCRKGRRREPAIGMLRAGATIFLQGRVIYVQFAKLQIFPILIFLTYLMFSGFKYIS